MIVGIWAQIQAAVIFLLPEAIVLLALSTRKPFAPALVVWLPTTVALDLLSCLLLSWVVPLQIAMTVSRFVWLAGAAWAIHRRRLRIAWPTREHRARVAMVCFAGLCAFAFSAAISRPYSIWDRNYHIPLVTMLRGQRMPLLTVFQSKVVLHFHFLGDIMASALQLFSGARMHSSLALALTHDLTFGVIGVALASWLTGLSNRKLWILPAIAAFFLSGPVALLRTGLATPDRGYSYLNLLCMSFRAPIGMAMLLLVGAFGALAFRLSGVLKSAGWFFAATTMCVAGLAISDEPSAVLLAVGLGAVWLVKPGVFHPNRRMGFLMLVGVGVAIVGPNLLFQAALVPGGPVRKLSLLPFPFRVPGYFLPPLSLGTKSGVYALLTDMAPFFLIAAALIGQAIRDRNRQIQGLAIALVAIVLVALFAVIALDFNGMSFENHRFATICMVVFPIAAVVSLANLPAGHWERIPLIGALFLSSISTVYWLENWLGEPGEFFTNEIDCRRSAGSHVFERPKPTYISRSSFYAFSGCRAVFYPGTPNTNDWSGVLFNGWPEAGRTALARLNDEFVSPDESLAVACSAGPEEADRVCVYAKALGTCKAAGSSFLSCSLTRADRDRLLSQVW